MSLNKPITIIAEAGVNHNGDVNLAYKLIELAADAGADIVKFQTSIPKAHISRFAPKANYQKKTTGSGENQLSMINKIRMPQEHLPDLKAHCEKCGIMFWCTAFDVYSVELLHSMDIHLWKIPSGEITNVPYLRKVASYGEPIIMSTGMATLGEVDTALGILEKAGTPRNLVTLLHCTTEYPACLDDVNLNAMSVMKAAFPGIAGIGYSDHTPGIEISVAAAAMGATVIEKHFTLDKNMEGPDHKASMSPEELYALVRCVRNVERALGDGVKRPAPEEMANAIAARKSLVAARNIAKGETFTAENMTTKRPGSGISAIFWDQYLGRKAERDYEEDELL